jgi:hypothetical protein
MIKHIEPNWNIEEFYSLNYSIADYHDAHELDLYVSKGHVRKNISLYKYHKPNPMPSCVNDYIISHFNYLENLTVAVNLFKPGQYLPYHSDVYTRYKEIFDVKDKTISRTMIMLEDWQPGQVLCIDTYAYTNWVAGDCYTWHDYEQHTFINLSLFDRYALQITGTLK